MNINQQYTLVLNGVWQALHFSPIDKALISLFSMPRDREGNAALAIDISYDVEPVLIDGVWDATNAIIKGMVPLSLEEWLKVPIRPFDKWVNTARMQIRVPTVTIAKHFKKMPMKYIRLTKKGIWQRDNSTCVYSGKKLTKSTGTLDHVHPKSLGGKDEWENLVLADKEINFKKGNKTLKESGLTLLKKPVAPSAVPITSLLGEAKHPDQVPFLLK